MVEGNWTDSGSNINPRYVKPKSDTKSGSSHAKDVERICTTCWVFKDLRTKHCQVTDRCISEFDHYCGWLGNAIGKENHRWFITLIFTDFGAQCLYTYL